MVQDLNTSETVVTELAEKATERLAGLRDESFAAKLTLAELEGYDRASHMLLQYQADMEAEFESERFGGNVIVLRSARQLGKRLGRQVALKPVPLGMGRLLLEIWGSLTGRASINREMRRASRYGPIQGVHGD